MAQTSVRTTARSGQADGPISAAAAVRVIVALSALGWCALLGAALALLP